MLGVLTLPRPSRSIPVSRRPPEPYHWTAELAGRSPNLREPFVVALALWSLGMIFPRRCGLSCVCLHPAERPGLARVANAWPRGQYPMPQQLTPEPWPEPDHEYATYS